MTPQTKAPADEPSAAAPVIQQKRAVSIIWLIPVIALLIGGWLVYKAISEKGPIITISFDTAEGIEIGKTKVKFKDVEVGVVKAVKIDEDLKGVIVTIEMKPGTKPYLTENSKFWVVTARIGTSEISGLGTLLGGVYIGLEPSTEGTLTNHFVGLVKPPIVTSEMRGTHFYLNANRLGSLNFGSPIYFRQIRVGRVVDYQLADTGEDLLIHLFIDRPFDQFVRENSLFWLASGLDLQLTADGLRVDTESVASLLSGGIAFSSGPPDKHAPAAAENARFTLYQSHNEAKEQQYTIEEQYYVAFFESIRGLSVGAPVEFRGLRIGSVEDIEVQADFEKLEFSTLVKIAIEKERLNLRALADQSVELQLSTMVDQGLRAQLKAGNLLTGQLFVDVDFFQEAVPAEIMQHNGLSVLPSIPSTSQKIVQDIATITANVSKLPLVEIGMSLQRSLAGIDRLVNDPGLQSLPQSLARLLAQTEQLIEELNDGTVPEVNTTLGQINDLVQELQALFSADSPLSGELTQVLRQLGGAARSIAELADLLERHPEALLQGKAMGASE